MIETWEGDVEVTYHPSGQKETVRGRVVSEAGVARAWEETDRPGFWRAPLNEVRRAAILDAALRGSMSRAGYANMMACAASQGREKGVDPATLLDLLIRACIDGPPRPEATRAA